MLFFPSATQPPCRRNNKYLMTNSKEYLHLIFKICHLTFAALPASGLWLCFWIQFCLPSRIPLSHCDSRESHSFDPVFQRVPQFALIRVFQSVSICFYFSLLSTHWEMVCYYRGIFLTKSELENYKLQIMHHTL